MAVDFDKICDFVEGVFAENSELAKMTLVEMGIDPNTRRPTPAAPDLPQACAAGNHYTNDGNGRWFDFCPDCGNPVS